MPMLTTSVIGLPVWPSQAPLRTASLKVLTRASTACTSALTSWPSTVELLVARRAQGGVQDGAVFGQVDLLAGEHGVAQALDAALARQAGQQFKRAPVQAVF